MHPQPLQPTPARPAEPEVRYVRMDDVETWHEIICATFSRTQYIPGEETNFRGELSSISLGHARMSRIQSSGGWFARDSRYIRSDRFDGYMFLMSQSGELRLSQGDDRYLANHGEALVYRHGTPFELDIPRKYLAMGLWVTPELMARHCPALVNHKAPIVLKRDSANGLLALAMIENLCTGAVTRQSRNADQLVGATLDVVATVGPEPDLREQRRNGALLRKLSDYVSRNIDDTDLNLDRLAEASGVSPRTLNRAFAQDGTTPMRWVWDRRLSLAHDALLHARVRNVTEAAFSFGFKDVAHFSRAFSRKFGLQPSTLLKKS